MSTQIKVDDDATATTLSRISSVEPVLRTSPFVEKGRKLCSICFSGAMKKNANRGNLQKITDISSYQQRLKRIRANHVKNFTKFEDAGQRILVNSSTTSTLFVANVGYHKFCYEAFRATS